MTCSKLAIVKMTIGANQQLNNKQLTINIMEVLIIFLCQTIKKTAK